MLTSSLPHLHFVSRLRSEGAWMGNFNHRALMVSASVSAYTAPTLMTICLLTDYWIYGKQTRLSQNPVVKAGDIRVLNFTYHRIGLWRECTREAFGKNRHDGRTRLERFISDSSICLSESPYVCELVRYSKTEAKLEKGFKAVSCKFFHGVCRTGRRTDSCFD